MKFFASLFRRRVAPPAAESANVARDAGDAARDRQDWPEAARHYRLHLEAHPGDAGIWVQQGHALKEASDLAGAEAAYRQAAELAPRDHDIPLQLGHALKLQGRLEEAAAAYAASDRLAPVNHAAEELAALAGIELSPRAPGASPRAAAAQDHAAAEGVRAAELDLSRMPADAGLHRSLAAALLRAGRRGAAIEAARAAFDIAPERRNWQAIRRAGGLPPEEGVSGGPHLYDVTDLLSMLRESGRATGIQRVQLGLAQGLMGTDARFVFVAERFGPLWTLRAADMAALIHYALHEPHDLRRAEALVHAAMESAGPTHLPSARLFFIMGAFWFWVGAPAALARLRMAGLRIGVLVYDLIPLSHPEHASEGTVAAFRQGLAEGAALWDFALTISEFTAAELTRQLAAMEAPAIPIRAMPLAHRISPPDHPDAAAFPPALQDLRGQDYVLCVGTIESRKNHAALFQAWQILLREGADPPPLVLVGRPGWRVADLMAQLEATDHLGGRIRLVHGVSDPELEGLYRGCLFSIFPSFTEGWGLPVGESLALGKVCLAALEGATPEAASGFAEPIDAYSPRDIAARVRHFTRDRAALATAEARLRAGFTPRGWPDVTRDFLGGVAAGMSAPAPQRAMPALQHLAAGDRLTLAPQSDSWSAATLALGAGFEPPEEPGSWLIGPSGTLHVEVSAPLTLWLRWRAVPWASGNRVGVALGDAPLRWASLEAGQEVMLAVDVPAGPATLRVVVDGNCEVVPGGDHRPMRVALREIHAIARDDRPLAPGRAVLFGASSPDAGWCGLLAEGWDHAAGQAGVAVLAPRATLRFRAAPGPLRVLLHLTLRPGAAGRLLHPGGGTELPATPALLLPLSVTADAEGWAGITLAMADHAVPPLHLIALQWAAEGDMEARLAMLESVLRPEAGVLTPSAERMAAIEERLRTAPPAPLPGGETGRAALRLAASRPG